MTLVKHKNLASLQRVICDDTNVHVTMKLGKNIEKAIQFIQLEIIVTRRIGRGCFHMFASDPGNNSSVTITVFV